MKTLQVLKSQKDIFSSLLRRMSVDNMEGPVNSLEVVDKSAWELSKTADHAMCLLTLKTSKHMNGLLENNTLYALRKNKRIE